MVRIFRRQYTDRAPQHVFHAGAVRIITNCRFDTIIRKTAGEYQLPGFGQS